MKKIFILSLILSSQVVFAQPDQTAESENTPSALNSVLVAQPTENQKSDTDKALFVRISGGFYMLFGTLGTGVLFVSLDMFVENARTFNNLGLRDKLHLLVSPFLIYVGGQMVSEMVRLSLHAIVNGKFPESNSSPIHP